MGTAKKQETKLIRVTAKTPELVIQAVKKVAVLSDGEVLTKARAIEYVLLKFLEDNKG